MAFLMSVLVLTMSFSSAEILGNANVNANAVANVKTKGVVSSLSEVSAEFESDSESFDSENVAEASSEIDASVEKEAKESTFAQVSIGQGWAIRTDSDPDEGSFARIFWVEKTFVNENTSTNTTINETTEARGTLKIGSELYKLVLQSETEDKIVFDVVSERTKTKGTLELNIEQSLFGFTTWSGDLEQDSGQKYDVHFATKNSRVKSTGQAEDEVDKERNVSAGIDGNLNASERGEGQKIGLWARIKAFLSSK